MYQRHQTLKPNTPKRGGEGDFSSSELAIYFSKDGHMSQTGAKKEEKKSKDLTSNLKMHILLQLSDFQQSLLRCYSYTDFQIR